MTARTHMIKFVLAATTIASVSGCDPEGSHTPSGFAALGEFDVVFRDDCDPAVQKCSYRNNFYLGIEEYELDNLPLVQGSDPDTEITRILAHECLNTRKMPLFGTFEAVAPDLTVDADGTFGALEFTKVGDPSVTCWVAGQLWEGTEWFISTVSDAGGGVVIDVDARLGISHMQITPGQSTLYKWQTDLEYVYEGAMQGWKYTCEEDPDPVLDFHAVVYPSLEIDGQTGVFGDNPDTAYLGCTSGLTAKSGYTWGYYPEGSGVHQVIANAGMAKYCGPADVSFTETGTEIAVWNKTGSGPDQAPIDPVSDPVWTPEAAWDSSMRAMCIGKTRRPEFQPNPGEDFDCGSFDLPPCTQAILDDPAVMFITYAKK